MEAGAASEALALIGGPSTRTTADAWQVAFWLWNEAEYAGLNRPAAILYNAINHSKYPASTNPQERSWYFPARTRAGIALARQLLSIALDEAGKEKSHPPTSAPTELNAVLGGWWASMIEAANLSDVAATLYQVKNVKPLRAPTESDGQLLHRASLTAWNSPDPDLPPNT